MHPTRRRALASLGALLSLPLLPWPPIRVGRSPSAFLDAVRRGELERVRALLAADPGLASACDERGRSAFVLAHLHGHEAVAALLRASGIELDLVESVLAQDWERVRALAAERPERLASAHPIGGTPLYAAALVGCLDLSRLRSLGCAPDAAPEGGTGFTPARGALESARAAWARIALSDLCGNGADPNARQRGGSSVLHGAVARRDEMLVRLAIRKGADVGRVDDAGRTAEALASELGWEAGAALLAAHERLPRDHRASRCVLDANRAPIEVPDLSDLSADLRRRVAGPAHFDLDGVRALVDAEPRLVFALSADDELPIEACAHTGARPIVRYLLERGAPLSLPTAVSLGDRDAVTFWLERDRRLVHERGAHDFPLLWYAVLGGGGVEMAELLARHGVGVDQESMGTTALHWCAKRGEHDLARWLLERGADLDAVGHKWSRAGETPLAIARARGDARMAALLADAGARAVR